MYTFDFIKRKSILLTVTLVTAFTTLNAQNTNNQSNDKKGGVTFCSLAQKSSNLTRQLSTIGNSNILNYNETEKKNTITNDEIANAEKLPSKIGSGTGKINRFKITGNNNNTLAPATSTTFLTSLETAETANDNIISAVALERSTNKTARIVVNGVIGDGLNSSQGTGRGDLDVYSINLIPGDLLTVNVTTTDTLNPLFPDVSIRNLFGNLGTESGAFSEISDSDGNTTFQFSMKETVTSTYLAEAEANVFFIINDASSFATTEIDANGNNFVIKSAANPLFGGPSNTTIEREGRYEMEVVIQNNKDTDTYSLDLEKGDLLSVSAEGAFNQFSVYDANNTLVGLGHDDLPFQELFKPSAANLPNSGTLSQYVTIAQKGTYFVQFEGVEDEYSAEVLVSRFGNESFNKGKKQIIYLDFTGDTAKVGDFLDEGAFGLNGRDLDDDLNFDAFENYLEAWGIENTTRNRTLLSHKITNIVKQNLINKELRNQNSNANVLILSDYGSPFLGRRIPQLLHFLGLEFTPIVIGGSSAEVGINTIGRAQQIDFGNYQINDKGFVLLDLLSAPARIEDTDDSFRLEEPIISINDLPLSSSTDISDAIAVVIGNIISHEAGHLFGCLHTSATSPNFSIMDNPINLLTIAGINSEEEFSKNTTPVKFTADFLQGSTTRGIDVTSPTNTTVAFAMSNLPNYYFGGKSLEREQKLDASEIELQSLEDEILNEIQTVLTENTLRFFPTKLKKNETAELSFTSPKNGTVAITIFSSTGQKITELVNREVIRNQTIDLDFSSADYNLSSGIYFCSFSINGSKESIKFGIE
ncbi:T9SS type A sorting domain-containing protein [Aquimarina agarivorans]|uniref:T9SS type A sorting domain-containing protein n=1 Tax=Aquimarina agarivorans TaxID=980584 RepID=UPI000248F8C7|nr:T9SS type A sorting domain-containing protein [Aquimarina agarivorans]